MGISYRLLPKSEAVRGFVIAVVDDNRVIGEIIPAKKGFEFIPLGTAGEQDQYDEIKTDIAEVRTILEACA